MSLGHSPRIITDGMVLCLDAANPKNFNLTKVEVLVVAGGGGGGTGGGGAGGLIYNSNFAVTPGTQLTVTVGDGGSGTSSWGGAGNAGGNSVFGSLTAIGGGAGLHRAGATNSGTGGSGGGDAGGSGYTLSNATAGQGFSGGNSPENGTTDEEPGGGGGGAGGPGENASTPTASNNATVRATAAGAGGPGLGFDISGTFTYYAGGGGGSNRNGVGKPGGIGGGGTGGASPTAGSPNTGGGGGGTGYSGYGGGGTSAAGGSGIVIVRYQGPQKAIGGTVTTSAGYTIHTFTTVGSSTFTPLVATNNSAILGLSDLSGRGNFGTTANSPTYSSANGGSISFDGTDEYVTSPSSSLFAFGTGDFTLEVWIYPESFSTYTHMIALPSQDTFALKANVSDGAIYFFGNSPAYSTYGSISGWTLSLNTWNHVVFKRESSIGYAFLNGSSKGSKSGFTNNFSAQVLNIRNGHPSEYAQCRISIAKIYNRALTAAEIQQNFNALRGRYGI